MIPVKQTDTTSETGNCFAACLASILEVPLGIMNMPVGGLDAETWGPAWDAFLAKYNLGISCFTPGGRPPRGYAIAGIKSPRFPDTLHAVVAYNGRIIHDPHPSVEVPDEGAEVVDWTIIHPLDPMVGIGGDVMDWLLAGR